MNDFQSLINEICDKADIVAIVSQYVKLEKKGSSYVGLCPFHEDKHPSMSVSPTKKVFKCFSCNAGGNVITFVEKYKKITFMEALREVGATVNINVSVTKTEIENQKNIKYYKIMEDAASFYHFYLKNTNEGQGALQYLNSRHLNEDIINRFKIGLSNSEEDVLIKYLTSKNHLPIDIVEIGLANSGNNGYYDRFRSRIMFPITNLDGKIVGFSGRKYLTSNSDEAKYINTSETVIFKKGLILYNYNEALAAIKKQNSIFLFEGFMDVIAAYRAGIFNTVASMGTSLTVDQIKAMKRLTNNIVVCYDGDEPGVEATKRAITLLLRNDMNIRVVSMPDELDPDEYINKYGSDALYNFLTSKTITGMEFLYQKEFSKVIIDDLNSIEEFKKQVFNYFRMYKSNVVLESYFKRLAEDIKVSIESLTNDYQAFLSVDEQEYLPSDIHISHKPKKKTLTRRFNLKKYLLAERQLIQLAYQNGERCAEIISKLNNNFVDPNNNTIMCKINQYYVINQNYDYERMRQKFTPDELDMIKDIINSNMLPDISQIDVLVDIVKKCPYSRKANEIIDKDEKNVNDLKELAEIKRKTINIRSKKED